VPQMDNTAKAALEGSVIAPAFFIFLDIEDDPIRITTFGANVTVTGNADAELNGTYIAVDHRVLDISSVSHSDGGSDTVTVDLSGLVTIDSQLLSDIGDQSKWRGRPIRLWFRLHDEANAPQGAFVPYYTGFASAVEIHPSPKSQVIRLKVENYLAAFNQASNRSYLNQKDYDPSDTSASASIAAANGAKPVHYAEVPWMGQQNMNPIVSGAHVQ
jgi:hypothetical protein